MTIFKLQGNPEDVLNAVRPVTSYVSADGKQTVAFASSTMAFTWAVHSSTNAPMQVTNKVLDAYCTALLTARCRRDKIEAITQLEI